MVIVQPSGCRQWHFQQSAFQPEKLWIMIITEVVTGSLRPLDMAPGMQLARIVVTQEPGTHTIAFIQGEFLSVQLLGITF